MGAALHRLSLSGVCDIDVIHSAGLFESYEPTSKAARDAAGFDLDGDAVLNRVAGDRYALIMIRCVTAWRRRFADRAVAGARLRANDGRTKGIEGRRQRWKTAGRIDRSTSATTTLSLI